MHILFVTKDFSGASLCTRLWYEGHEICAYIHDARYSDILDGRIAKMPDMQSGLDWVGKDGLIVCDDNGFGDMQDLWRSRGYSVIGGSGGGDRLESDREYAQQVFSDHGLYTIPTHTFDSVQDAVTGCCITPVKYQSPETPSGTAWGWQCH